MGVEGGESSGRACREAKSAFCFCDLATCACLCCKDLVISSVTKLSVRPGQIKCTHTKIISEVHPALRKLLNRLPHDLIFQFALAFVGSGWGRGRCS